MSRALSSIGAEQAVLGAMLMDSGACVAGLDALTVEMFSSNLHQTIFEAMLSINAVGRPIDLITLSEDMKRSGKLEEAGGVSYLIALEEACPSSANIDAYIKPVKDYHTLRQIRSLVERMAREINTGEKSIEELVSYCEGEVLDVSKTLTGTSAHSLADLVSAQRKRVLEASRSTRELKGVPTGFYDLDRMTSGLKPDELITLAGCSSMGKSAMASQIAFNVLKATRLPVLVFSLEMSKEQWIDRMTASEARVEAQKIQLGRMSNDEWRRLDRTQKMFNQLPMHIIDTPAMTSQSIKADSRRLAAKHGTPALVVIDYLQIAETVEQVREERLRVTRMVRDFKNLARQLKAPVLCLSQLSRDVAKRENNRPMLSDLRETSAIEAESDIVLFVHRPSYYKAKKQADYDPATDYEPDLVICGKQRNGPTGDVEVRFMNEFTRFENYQETP